MVSRLNTARAGAIAALAVVTLGASTASAAPPAPNATIASPSNDALISGRTVAVRISVTSKVTGVRVFAGSKDVSTRFSRSGNAYAGRIPRSLLKTGENTLVVQALQGKALGNADISTFIVDKPAGRATMRATQGSAAAAAMAKVNGYTPTQGVVPVSIHTATPMFARVSVNGRRAATSRDLIAANDHSWIVSPSNGLRAGRNTIKVEAYDATGAHAVQTFTVNRDKTLPLTRAGATERRVAKNTWTRLNASKSRAANRKDKLAYAWRVVKTPKGAKPVLRDADSATPRFKPDIPGTYKLALRATTQRNGLAGAAAAGPAAEDAVTVDATPSLGHQGLYVGTDLQHGSDPDHYATMDFDGTPYASADPEAVDIALSVDPSTLEVKSAGTVENTPVDPSRITIYDWSDKSIPGKDGTFGSQIYIGSDMVANTHTNSYAGEGNPGSNLHGWLQPASTTSGGAKWIPSDYLQVQTRNANESAGQNTITVNDWSKTVTVPSTAKGGWQAVALDNAGHVAWAPDAYVLNGDAGDTAVENKLASDLSLWAGQGITLLVQGFGQVGSVPEGSDLGNEIDALGGQSATAYALDGTADADHGAYALISSLHLMGGVGGWSGAEASANRLGGGTLTALLTREPKANDYVVMQSDRTTPDLQRYRFTPELWAAPTSYAGKVRNEDNDGYRAATDGEQAAMSAIVDTAVKKRWTSSAGVQCPNAPDAIRGTYCDTTGQVLQTLKDNIHDLTYADMTAPTFSAADFKVAHDTFDGELGDAADVRATIGSYQAIYSNDAETAGFSASVIGQNIQKALDDANAVNATGTSSTDPLDVLAAGSDMLAEIPEAGDVFSFLSSTLEFAKALQSDDGDQPVPSQPHQVEMTAANAGSTMGASFQKLASELSRNGDYIVEDPQKLLTGGYDLGRGDLALDDDRTIALEKTAAAATREYLWGTILGTSFANWTGDAKLAPNLACGMSDKAGAGAPYFYPNNNADWKNGIGQFGWRLPATNGPAQNWYIMENQTSDPASFIYGHNDVGLPAAMADQIFGAYESTKDSTDDTQNIGAVAPYFQEKYLPFMTLKSYAPGYTGKGCYQNP